MGSKITADRFEHIQEAAIRFIDILVQNQETANQVACRPGVQCAAVVTEPLNYQQNKISGNKLVKPK
jgi:hypothetical protein